MEQIHGWLNPFECTCQEVHPFFFFLRRAVSLLVPLEVPLFFLPFVAFQGSVVSFHVSYFLASSSPPRCPFSCLQFEVTDISILHPSLKKMVTSLHHSFRRFSEETGRHLSLKTLHCSSPRYSEVTGGVVFGVTAFVTPSCYLQSVFHLPPLDLVLSIIFSSLLYEFTLPLMNHFHPVLVGKMQTSYPNRFVRLSYLKSGSFPLL